MSKGYDLSERFGYRLIQGRLGIYDKYEQHNTDLDTGISGIQSQLTRINYHGGNLQQKRMIADKRRSLDRAIWYSYQGAEVIKTDSKSDKPVRALINPNKLKQDYDDKIISIGFEHDFEVGTVFKWVGTGTYWLIYLQDLTELAYFRGDIRKCTHEISWEDENGKHSTFAAIRGPVETKIDSSQKHGISMDNPNYSLHLLVPKNEETLKYFQRYSKFYLKGTDDLNLCWKVEAIDWLSVSGILEINATEYYRNETEDDIENGIVGGLIVEPQNPNTDFIEDVIVGETFIKPKKEYEYTYKGRLEGKWSVATDGCPIALKQDGKTVKVRWLDTYSGQFDLVYADCYKKTIVVESLF